MKINYSMKEVVAGMVLLLGMTTGFISCGQTDNPIEKETVVKINDGVTIKVSVPSDITKILSEQLKGDIALAAASGDTYTVTIDASIFTVSASDNTITIPQIEDAKIVLDFKNNFTAAVPLVIKSEKEGDTSVASENEITINLPNSSTGIEIEINMPATTVTVSGGTVINSLTALTATNTLIIEKDVTIKTLIWEGGNIVVKDGAKIEELGVGSDTESAKLFVFKEGISYASMVRQERAYGQNWMYAYKNEEGSNNGIPNIKVLRGDIDISYSLDRLDNEDIYKVLRTNPYEKLTIADGATVTATNLPVKIVEGEGDAKLFFSGARGSNENGGRDYSGAIYNLESTLFKNLSIAPYIDDLEEYKDVQDSHEIHFYFDGENDPTGEHTITFENCSFCANTFFGIDINGTKYQKDENGNIVTEQTTFYCAINGEDYWRDTSKDYVVQQSGNPDIEVEPNKEGGYWVEIHTDALYELIEYSNYTAIIELVGCTIGGNNITGGMDIIRQHHSFIPTGTTRIVNIDGQKYKIEISNNKDVLVEY